jgi:hypothetical protein
MCILINSEFQGRQAAANREPAEAAAPEPQHRPERAARPGVEAVHPAAEAVRPGVEAVRRGAEAKHHRPPAASAGTCDG